MLQFVILLRSWVVVKRRILSSYERKGVSMGDDGFFDGGWYPHDGEGKIDNCPGPGCDCCEFSYKSRLRGTTNP
jgi:hypothetical protein